jgi:hypothetical protein
LIFLKTLSLEEVVFKGFSRIIKFFFFFKISNTSKEILGAINTSKNLLDIASAVSFSISVLNTKMPPKLLTSSHFKALSNASNCEFAMATPQGFACFIIPTTGLVLSNE